MFESFTSTQSLKPVVLRHHFLGASPVSLKTEIRLRSLDEANSLASALAYAMGSDPIRINPAIAEDCIVVHLHHNHWDLASVTAELACAHIYPCVLKMHDGGDSTGLITLSPSAAVAGLKKEARIKLRYKMLAKAFKVKVLFINGQIPYYLVDVALNYQAANDPWESIAYLERKVGIGMPK